MREITQFNHLPSAQRFVDYMATQGVILTLSQDYPYRLLANDETTIALVERELGRFLQDPLHARYVQASWLGGRVARVSQQPGAVTDLWVALRARAGPVTLGVMTLCVIVYLATLFSGNSAVLTWLGWPASPADNSQLWRWITPIFVHFSLLHILFNLVWWWYLGGQVEQRLGRGSLLTIVLISSLLSNWMQAKFGGVYFGGLSGVVYALIGYCWLFGMRVPSRGIFVENGLVLFSVLWLVICYFGPFGLAIANTAHLVGLLVGLAMGYLDSWKKRPIR